MELSVSPAVLEDVLVIGRCLPVSRVWRTLSISSCYGRQRHGACSIASRRRREIQSHILQHLFKQEIRQMTPITTSPQSIGGVRSRVRSFLRGLSAKMIDSHHEDQSSSSEGRRARPNAEARMLAQRYSRENLQFVRTVGTGSFGRVFVATVKSNETDKEETELVAVKRLTKSVLIAQRQVQHTQQEREILRKLHHPFIVRMLNTFKDDYYLYIVMEFVQGGEFFNYLRKKNRLEAPAAQFYAACITCIFEYIHTKDIIYRDLKPENMLIDHEGYIKLTDFGFAKHVKSSTYTLCGTPEYIAPEVILNKGHGKGVDWWTLGILIYEMTAGIPPFTDPDVMRIYQKILGGKIYFPKGFIRDARSICKHLLAHDLSRRYGGLRDGVNDIKRHRWFRCINFNELERRLAIPPYVPRLENAHDHSHFSKYTESQSKPPPIIGADDPFTDF